MAKYTTKNIKLGVRFALPLPESNSEERREVIGSLLFADPSAAEFPRHINDPYDDPGYHSRDSQGPIEPRHGKIRTVTARETTYWDPKRAARDAAEVEGNVEIKEPYRFGYRGRA